MERLVITGGCGFIGVNLIDYLRRTGDWSLTVLDNLSVGRREYLKPYDVDFIEGDIRDREVAERAMKKAFAVVHLAADTRVIESIENPAKNFETNVIGTFELLQIARRAQVERFVFASTGGAIIGPAVPPVHESMVPRPVSPYGASKLAGEAYLSAYYGAYGLKTVALRFSNVYGPRSFHKGSVIAQFFRNVLEKKTITVYGDGSQTRDYIYVDDICNAIALGIKSEKGGEAYQLGSGVPTSINEILELMRRTIAPANMPEVTFVPFRTGEIVHTHSNIDKARRELGYSPSVKLEDGLARTWQWFISNSRAP